MSLEDIRTKIYLRANSGKEPSLVEILLLTHEVMLALAEELIREKEKKP